MADIGAKLSAELTRIVDCSYPASLSHLADLLARADALTVRACIHDRSPCAVSRLAINVCEALPLWAYTLRILSSLCQSPEFVDTLLLQNPSLLDALLTKANSSPRDHEEYAATCVLLLSRPLPAFMPLPASAQTFFLRVFERARQSPDVCTLKPVYSILNGSCRDLLSLLPTDGREQFDQALSHILSSNGAGQNYMLMLWCFGIVLLAEHSGESEHVRSSIENRTASPRKQWKTASGHKMFGSIDKVYKMISLTYLSVIFATKGDVGVSDDDAIEGIRIAVCTLRCVDRKVLRSWPTSSPLAKGTFTKLPLKILRANISPAVQIEALSFYSMVAGECRLPADIVTQYERCLINTAELVNPECLGETLLISLPIYSQQIQQKSINTLIESVLDSCISPPNFHRLSNLKALVEQMTTIVHNCEPLRTRLLSTVSCSEQQDKIWAIIRNQAEPKDTTCQAHIVSLHKDLISAIIALLLNLTLTVQPTESAMPLALSAALINKQRQALRATSRCIHGVTRPERTAVSLFQQKNTPYTGQHLQDWRDRLKSDLENQGFFQRDSVIRSVAQICQDLETRCNTVEGPLRREQEKSHGLERHVGEMNERIASLEVQAADDRFHSEGLEDEKSTISEERDSLVAKLKHLEAETDEAIRKADEVLIHAREDYNAKELELRSTILTYEEAICAHEQELETRQSGLEELRKSIAHVEEDRRVAFEQIEALQHQLNDSKNDLAKETETVCNQLEEITQLKDRKIELELHLSGAEAEIDTLTARLSDLQVSHQELVQSSEEAYKDLEHKYTRDLEFAAAHAQSEREEVHTKLEEAIQNGQRAGRAYEETRRELQQAQDSIPSLEEKIQELTDFCSEQEEELEELRTLRKNVLASMGLASQNPLAIRSVSRSQKDTNELQTPRAPREHRRRKSALQTLDDVSKMPRGTQGASSTAMENVANASFVSSDSYSSQNGSTPKRSKVRSSFKVPAMHAPYTQNPILSSRSISKKLSPIKRSALRQLSPNRRHTTVGFAATDNEEGHPDEMRSVRKRRGSLQDVEEADFDMEELLAGTPLTPGNFAAGTGRVPDDDDDGTATDL